MELGSKLAQLCGCIQSLHLSCPILQQFQFWSADCTAAVLAQAKRAALLERETGLQRWAIKLELESSRQAAAAKTLQQQLSKVALSC